MLNLNNPIVKLFMGLVRGYNHDKYWKRRAIVVDPSKRVPLFIKLYYLYYIKKVDAKFGCSFGTNLNGGSIFKSPPHLPHGPYGIIVGHKWIIGSNCTIFHQVTLGNGGVIGDNVLFSAGSKVLGDLTIGNNVKVGSNAVVIENIPNDATVVLTRPRIIVKSDEIQK